MLENVSIEELLARIGSEKRIHYSLDHVQAALAEAGDPHKSVQTIVIGGTNGKGGTTYFLAAALQAHGYRVCTYVSPHLQSVRERFLFNLEPIERATLDRLAVQAYPYAERFGLTYFEFLTLIFFLWCREVKPDYVLLEVGMGGKQDATNVTKPLATVLTNISYDHEAYLGDTLEAILEEKMGIFRPRTPIFSSLDNYRLTPLLERRAQELKAPLSLIRAQGQLMDRNWEGQTLELAGEKVRIVNPSYGAARNAELAWHVLGRMFPQIPSATKKFAFEHIHQPGRMEIVQTNPRVILSGDHNEDGIRRLTTLLAEFREPSLYIVAGFSLDKPYHDMFQALEPYAERTWLTAIPSAVKELPPDYPKMGEFIEDAETAVKTALANVPPEGTLLVTGSLYLVGAVRSLWHKV